MHFEVLVEDQSGKIALESILVKLLGAKGEKHSWTLHAYKGIGRLPKGLKPGTSAEARILLDQLPRILRGYGKSLQEYGAVVVVVDQDSRDCRQLKADLLKILNDCNPRPLALFRIAVEEMESWFLGDRHAIVTAYPKAKLAVLNRYVQDSVCGTWEVLADAIHPGGAEALKDTRWPASGQAKCEWAAKIGPEMEVDANGSPSFRVFRDGIRCLTGVKAR